MLHTLLLNSTYESIGFISDRKVFKLLVKDKVEILESWEGSKIYFGKGITIDHPAVLRLKHHVRWIPKKVRFNRTAVFRRDQHICQYCGKALTPSKLTLDHIFPRARGGDNSWKNCVTACFICNNKKGNRTPEEAGMRLIKKPITPTMGIANEYHLMHHKHESWKDYIPTV
jgi:5-methylcytosine-specific restriction endonuclease McrA